MLPTKGTLYTFDDVADRMGRPRWFAIGRAGCGEDRTMATSYVVRWNLPGCMPDCDPAEFDTLDEARRYLIGVLKRNEDSAESEDDAEEWCALAEEANLIGASGGICAGPDGYVYVLDSMGGAS